MRCVIAGAVFLSASVASGAIEAAKGSDKFVDSIGINTHYFNAIFAGQNGYSFADLDLKLAQLGIRHIRDNAVDDPTDPPRDAASLARIDGLYTNYGIRATLVPGNTGNTPVMLKNYLAAHSAFEAVEGLNEPDANARVYGGFTDNPGANSYPATIAYQNDLYTAVKNDPLTSGRFVLSPAMGASSRSQYLLGAASSFQYEAMHSYPNGRLPTNGLDTKIGQTNAMSSPSKPIVATETGYYTKTADGGQVSEAAMGKYIPRLYAEYFNRGIARAFSYELIDQNPTSDKESNFGLLHWDRTPKPAYTALANLIDLMEEPGASFTPGNLSLTITGAPTTVHHTVLEKINGTFEVLIWNDVSVWNTATQTDTTNADVSLQLLFGQTWPSVRTYLPGQSTTALSTFTNVSTLNLNVPDQVMVVELVPEPSTTAALAVASILLIRRRRRPPIP